MVEVGAAFAEGQIERLAVVIERGSELSDMFEADGEIAFDGARRLEIEVLPVALPTPRVWVHNYCSGPVGTRWPFVASQTLANTVNCVGIMGKGVAL